MHIHRLSEKQLYLDKKPTNRAAYLIITCLLYVLLWTTLYVIGSTLYITISLRGHHEAILVPDVISVTTASISIIHIALHNTATVLSRSAQTESKNNARLRIQWLATRALRLSVTMWLISSGLSVTFTLARHPSCSFAATGQLGADVGMKCIMQRSVIGASLLALTASLVLFVISYKTEDPFRAHLFGVVKEQALLPLMLPYKTSIQRPMFSEMSFKCRSSTSLSSHTLVPSCNSTTTLLPKTLEKAVGLGIYAPKMSTAFLAPRPSLSSIRTHTTLGSMPPPPPSPLPPLPAYFPEKYRAGGAMRKAIYPPRRPPRPERAKSERTVRIVPPSPALSIANLAMHNHSVESLSSVYSRSISGEKHSPKALRSSATTNSSRSYSSGSTATIIKSPLGAMRLADRPDIVLMNKSSRVSSGSSNTEIDDVETLQAKLPSVKAVSEFGDVQTWRSQNLPLDCTNAGGDGPYREEFKQRPWMPLLVRKARDSRSMFQYSHVKAVV